MSRPILIMVQHLDHGGTELHIHDLVTRLDRSRFTPHVIHATGGLVAQRLADAGAAPVTRLPIGRAYDLSGLRAIGRVRRYIREHRIEAIVSFHFVADFICGLAATDLGVPVISSRRDMGFTRTGRQKQAGRLLRGRFARWIAVSDAVRQAIHRDEAIPLDRIEVVYNGIDIDALDAHGCCREAERARHQIGDDELVVGCVANFNAVKRHVTLIEAVDRLRRSYPQLKLRLVLTGDGPERPNIEQRIRELNLGDTVILAGRSEQPTGALLAADIFVLPSESEGFSNAIVQAMACRRPVVACRVGGNPEAVDEGTTGFLVEPGDAEALARGIEPLLLDIDLRRRMGEAGRERALQHFSIDAMMRRTQQIVEDEIARHR